MIKRIIHVLTILFLILGCKKTDNNTKIYKAGVGMNIRAEDTNGDGKKDTWGYYLNDPGNYRIVYLEIDKNSDGTSDDLIWTGLHPASPKGRAEKEIVKVHEEEDTDNDGVIDTLYWMLPNKIISLSQVDTNKDGYFETTNYFNFENQIVRVEKDTNFDGKADQYFWSMRVEVDTNYDGKPDMFATADTKKELEEFANNKEKLKPLDKDSSWFLNPSKVPQHEKAIIGSGYF
ncbi:MAG: hypothetical protein KDK90_20725 [Leptospiraceae bacterium]|nr:hypothetical protein [Leptospiraceae bacterium]